MAEVSCLQIHELEENPLPFWSFSNEFDFYIFSDIEFDVDYENADVIGSELNQVAYVMNRPGEDLNLSLGLGLWLYEEEEEDDDAYIFERRKGSASASGDATSAVEPNCVGTVEFDSDFDDENGVIELDLCSEGEHGDGDEIEVSLRWDSLRLDTRNTEFEWEEIDERGDEVFGMFVDPDNEDDEEGPVALSAALAVTNEEVEVSVQRAEAVQNVEWEVLLNSSNWEPDGEEVDHDAVAAEHFRDGGSDDYIFTAEYDMLFGQFSENESAGMGRPPAAKFVVETLPSVVVRPEEVKEGDVVCAVCKEDISLGERGKRLPCAHRYHGECIVPWLKIMNTCPVCRFELPTDDVAYERRKSQRTSDGLNFPPFQSLR